MEREAIIFIFIPFEFQTEILRNELLEHVYNYCGQKVFEVPLIDESEVALYQRTKGKK